MKTRMAISEQHARELRARAPSLGQGATTLTPYQTRTCARCGRITTFVLEDAAGGWYSCIECGRFA
jgi:PHP family Zn ribbon phosphoesterase